MKSAGYYWDALSILFREKYAQFRDLRIKEKVVIFESDDWGAIRVPSKEVHDKLIEDGYELDSRPYEHLDGLESDEDVLQLSNLLESFRDYKGNPPKFTLNYLSANPDFDKIKAYRYQRYIRESIKDTYQSYPSSANVIDIVKEGMETGVFSPQFHGREHFNISMWMEALQNKDNDILNAFNVGMCGIFPKENPSLGNKYMVAYKDKLNELQTVIKEGCSEFNNIWGGAPKSFIAPCYTWPTSIEGTLNNEGIRIIQTSRFQREPASRRKIVHWLGERNKYGQIYTVRNCAFEPATCPKDIDVVERTMAQIRQAFKRRVPAIISTHRINYTSRLLESNASRSRDLLSMLLKQIISEFPDVVFSCGVTLFCKK